MTANRDITEQCKKLRGKRVVFKYIGSSDDTRTESGVLVFVWDGEFSSVDIRQEKDSLFGIVLPINEKCEIEEIL